jgi:hypothetical protein
MSGNLWEALTAIAAVATLGVGVLVAILFGLFEAAIVFVVGWLLLVPVFGILSDTFGPSGSGAGDEIEAAVEQRVADSIADAGDSGDAGSTEDPLEALRERYARGELGDEEFERKLERLIETEDVEVPDGVSLGDVDLDRDGERDAETDDDVAFER